MTSAAPLAGARAETAYVVGCDAGVDRVDPATGNVKSHVDLAVRADVSAYLPAAPAPADGCLLEDPAVGADGVTFLATATDARGVVRRLTFALPELSLRIAAPADAAKDAAAPPPSTAEVDGRPAQLLEASGGRRLLRVFSPDGVSSRFAVADARGASVLLASPQRSGWAARLAPGGDFVLTYPQRRGLVGGPLELYDARSGKRLGVFAQGAPGMRFLALSPGGSALLHRARAYLAIPLGRKFAAEPVAKPGLAVWPFVFFAPR